MRLAASFICMITYPDISLADSTTVTVRFIATARNGSSHTPSTVLYLYLQEHSMGISSFKSHKCLGRPLNGSFVGYLVRNKSSTIQRKDETFSLSRQCPPESLWSMVYFEGLASMAAATELFNIPPVSYTHLTLPTLYSV